MAAELIHQGVDLARHLSKVGEMSTSVYWLSDTASATQLCFQEMIATLAVKLPYTRRRRTQDSVSWVKQLKMR